jgi:hypothetical protein
MDTVKGPKIRMTALIILWLIGQQATGNRRHSPYLNQKCKDNYHSRYVSDNPYLHLDDDLDQSIENNAYITPQS